MTQAEALATLDAWLAKTDPVTGTLKPSDPGYWPPPVAMREAFGWDARSTPSQKPRARTFARGVRRFR
jgi:hypothetical protein